MGLTVDYFLAPHSPWTYLGHQRFADIAKAAGATINLLPVDLGKVFPATGGLPLAKRAPERQAYRLVELERFGRHLDMPIKVKPRYFPVASDDAARLIIAVDLHDGTDAAMAVTWALLKAVWVEERNIAEEKEIAAIVAALGLPSRRIEDSHSQAAHERFETESQAAIEAGVFGAPTYRIDGELYWGQDRLDFVQRRLAAG